MMNWFTKKWEIEKIRQCFNNPDIVDDGLKNSDPYAILWVNKYLPKKEVHVFSADKNKIQQFIAELVLNPEDISSWFVIDKNNNPLKGSFRIYFDGI